jgi:hypothetical protein
VLGQVGASVHTLEAREVEVLRLPLSDDRILDNSIGKTPVRATSRAVCHGVAVPRRCVAPPRVARASARVAESRTRSRRHRVALRTVGYRDHTACMRWGRR